MTFRISNLIKSLLLSATLLAAGCAGFPGNELPKRGYDALDPVRRKAVVDYAVTFSGQGGQRMYSASYLLSERVKAVFDKSGIFSKHTLDGKGAPVQLSIKLDNKGDQRTAKLLGIVARAVRQRATPANRRRFRTRDRRRADGSENPSSALMSRFCG